ncbi:MAG: polyphosphate polymerase domain-containing protein [Ruminococcaceae bacterium]|nr:polyphosphate polymerase domain-containing protein [Oscillospiraceae bacterium]
MKLRHEWKHEINMSDYIVLRQRLSTVMQYDEHYQSGKYEIRSLYFDNLYDKALMEKINGVSKREKFRIRLYNSDESFISLEKKTKIGGLTNKQSNILTADEAKMLSHGHYEGIEVGDRAVLLELIEKMKTQGLMPKTIVDYTREAFVYAPGNVRVTLDYNIRTGIYSTDLLNSESITVPAGNAIILEVKWDEFLPDIIRDIIQLTGRQSSPFSKYAACRIYG